MHPRFARASTVRAVAAESSFDLVVAETRALRLLGLMGVDEEDLVPLLFPRCRSIHTFWMKAPIDVVWLELDGPGARVLDVTERVGRRRSAKAPPGAAPRRSIAALEIAPGEAERLGLEAGQALTLA